jgi:hypothetical protein
MVIDSVPGSTHSTSSHTPAEKMTKGFSRVITWGVGNFNSLHSNKEYIDPATLFLSAHQYKDVLQNLVLACFARKVLAKENLL